jgi:hypothetical protein
MPFYVRVFDLDGNLSVTPYYRGTLEDCTELMKLHNNPNPVLVGKNTEDILRQVIFKVMMPKSQFQIVFMHVSEYTPFPLLRSRFMRCAHEFLDISRFAGFLDEFEWFDKVIDLYSKERLEDETPNGYLLLNRMVENSPESLKVARDRICEIVTKKPWFYVVVFWNEDYTFDTIPLYKGNQENCERLGELLRETNMEDTVYFSGPSTEAILWRIITEFIVPRMAYKYYEEFYDNLVAKEPDFLHFEEFLYQFRNSVMHEARSLPYDPTDLADDFCAFLHEFKWFDSVMYYATRARFEDLSQKEYERLCLEDFVFAELGEENENKIRAIMATM